jgi:hypothetical protein
MDKGFQLEYAFKIRSYLLLYHVDFLSFTVAPPKTNKTNPWPKSASELHL